MPKISGTVILNPDINGWELKPKSPFKLPGWWLNYPSEKYEFVSWGYYSQYMEKNVPNHQPASHSCLGLETQVVTLATPQPVGLKSPGDVSNLLEDHTMSHLAFPMNHWVTKC